MPIHPTSVVDAEAEVDPTADIGPFCVVGPHVRIGARTRLLSHIVVQNRTTLGTDNEVHPFASLGGNPQDLKYGGEPAKLTIGNHNVIRESVTMNIGTSATLETRVGNHCTFMACIHIAHDCVVGDHVVMANNSGLAGHVTVQDHVILGGFAGVHQFCRVGHHAFLAGGAMVHRDVPPYCIAQGDRAQLVGINVVGLKRAGWTRDDISMVREAFRKLFLEGATRLGALERTESSLASEAPTVKEMTDFIREAQRGICPPRLNLPQTETFET